MAGPCRSGRAFGGEGKEEGVVGLTETRADSTDILHFLARVLVIEAGRGGNRAANVISNTVLRVYS